MGFLWNAREVATVVPILTPTRCSISPEIGKLIVGTVWKIASPRWVYVTED